MSIAVPPSPESVAEQKVAINSAIQECVANMFKRRYPEAKYITPKGEKYVLHGAPLGIAARVIFEALRHEDIDLPAIKIDNAGLETVLADNIDGEIPDLEIRDNCLVWNRGEGISVMALEAFGFNDEWVQAFETLHRTKVGKIYFKLGWVNRIEPEKDEYGKTKVDKHGEVVTHDVFTLPDEIEQIVRANPEIKLIDVLEMSTRTIGDIQIALAEGKCAGLQFSRTLPGSIEYIDPDNTIKSLYAGVERGCAEATQNFMTDKDPASLDCAPTPGEPFDPTESN